MNRYTAMSSGSRFRGHGAVGHDHTAIRRALHQVYARAVGTSSAGERYVTNPRTDKTVGVIKRMAGHDVFCRRVREPDHRFNKLSGWALEVRLVEHLEHLGVTWVCFMMGNRRLYAALRDFRAFGKPINYGYGGQLLLAESNFQNCIAEVEDPFEDTGRDTPVQPAEPTPAAKPQRSLFEVET